CSAPTRLTILPYTTLFRSIKWTSEVTVDRDRVEIHFQHLKAFTKGMHVVWTFDEKPDGVLVTILHDLNFRVKILAPLADKIIGRSEEHTSELQSRGHLVCR